MARWIRVLLFTALACASALPAAAQRGRVEIAQRGWLGFYYDPVFSLGARAGLRIRQVWDDSPAARAGIQPGDTLLEVNGITATQQLVASLGSSLAPGDTVRLRLRRGGRDRALTLQAAERSDTYASAGDGGVFFFSPDSVRMRLRVLTDSLRVYADTFRMPRVYLQWQDDDGRYAAYWRAPDSNRPAGDKLPGRQILQLRDFNGSRRIYPDSVLRELRGGIEEMRIHTDSLFRFIEADTAGHRRFVMDFDSLARVHATPFEAHAWPGISTFALRGIAGAELTDLTPGLARVFKTRHGVLVLRVPERTPARRAGLAEADVIVRANGTSVGSVAELQRVVSRAQIASEPARLEVLRDGKRLVIVLTSP